MASRGFVSYDATMNQTTIASRFENMLNKVDNMIKSNNIYSVWIRLDIGKNNPLVFNSASQNKDENLVMSLDYEKAKGGSANIFTIKVAFDLFDHGQQTKTRVEKLDELLYKAMNISAVEEKGQKAEDILYCKFQYGYNVVGDTQIVSPLYEGIITEIKPSINYTNGKTYYTFKGTSFITRSSIPHDYNAIGTPGDKTSGWKGLDLVKWILWYYHGNPSNAKDIGYEGNVGNQDESVLKIPRKADIYNIDIPQELIDSSSQVQADKVSDMSAFDYCKEILRKTYNTKDSRYNSQTNTYNLTDEDKENGFTPYYEMYITDSGGGGVPTVHVTYIGSERDKLNSNGVKKIDFNFEWFRRSNNIVLNWEPEVNVLSYLVTRASVENSIEKAKRAKQILEEARSNSTNNETDISKLSVFGLILSLLGQGAEKIKNLGQDAAITFLTSQIQELEKQNIEYYSSTITLVGIPSDVPLGTMLQIKPKILEAVSRTQGMYYITGASDHISTNGLFTTKIDLLRMGGL